MKKESSETEARVKAENYCAKAERCRSEVRYKLRQWGAPAESEESILLHLEKEGFVDERRYAVAFVRDKYRFSQWGRIKITQALRMKQVPEACVQEGLAVIDDEEYRSVLSKLLERKRRTVKGVNGYELNGKLIRFAAGHGYELDEILDGLKRIGCNDEYMD